MTRTPLVVPGNTPDEEIHLLFDPSTSVASLLGANSSTARCIELLIVKRGRLTQPRAELAAGRCHGITKVVVNDRKLILYAFYTTAEEGLSFAEAFCLEYSKLVRSKSPSPSATG